MFRECVGVKIKFMKVEKITLKTFVLTVLTGCTFLIVLGAILVPILCHYHVVLSESFYGLYDRICHASTNHAFFIKNYPMPICARCLGIYSGIFLTLLLYFEQIKIGHGFYVFFGVLGIGEFLLEYFNLFFPPLYISMLAGMFIGIFLAVTFLRLEIKLKKGY